MYKTYIFFDLEATAFTHEIIEVGMVVASLKDHHFNILETYSSYIKTESKIGKYVSQLTHITKELLDEKGQTLDKVVNDLSILFSKYKSKLFFSFSRNDLDFLKKSLNHEDMKQEQIKLMINRYYVDLQYYLSWNIRDDKGNIMSIKKMLDFFNIKYEDESLHSSLTDSISLLNIMNEYFAQRDKVIDNAISNFKNLRAYKNYYRATLTDDEKRKIIEENM